jgi:predicted TIM-barrel fold metal-dependent hydrolase
VAPTEEAGMIIDVHTHIFPRRIRRDREAYFGAEPDFELLYRSPKSRLIGAAELLDRMDADGVDKAVVFGFPWLVSDTFKAHNDYILEAVQRFPDRLIGLGCFDAASPEAEFETERCLSAGLAGIGELAFYRSGIDADARDRLVPVMACCRARQAPVMIHTNEPVGHSYAGKTPNTLAQIEALLSRFPDNRIILAHWGAGLFFYSLMKKGVRETLRNAYFDTAASPYLYAPDIYPLAVKLIGVGKILFGSDYPLLAPARYFNELRNCGLNQNEIDAICGQNAARLFGL